jgi:hypothetical protein
MFWSCGFLKMSFELGESIQNLWDVIQRPENREALKWVGGGIAAVATGAWAVVKYFAERKKTVRKRAAVRLSRKRDRGLPRVDTTYQGPVNFAPSRSLSRKFKSLCLTSSPRSAPRSRICPKCCWRRIRRGGRARNRLSVRRSKRSRKARSKGTPVCNKRSLF